jgi:hypothetical protein
MAETPNDFEVEDCEEECDYTDYIEQVLLPAMSEENRRRFAAEYMTAAAYAERYPEVESEEVAAAAPDDFPEAYVEPDEFLLDRPIPPHPRPVPLIVSPSRVGTASIRAPHSCLMVPKVATPFPRPPAPGAAR